MATLLDTLDPIFADCVLKPWDSVLTRYQIDRPWIADGWVYATDGRIAVRQSIRRKDTKGRFPLARGTFEDYTPKAGTAITLPRIGRKRPDLVRCTDCRGRGCNVSECIEGKMPRKTRAIDIGGGDSGLADRYIWLLRDHGVTIVQPTTHATGYAFAKGQIEGRLMGMALGCKGTIGKQGRTP